MPVRIATVDNLSGCPFRLVKPPDACQVSFLSPRAVYETAKAGNCDVALLPSARMQELSPAMKPLGAYGIACTGSVFSVVLFSQLPARDLVRLKRPVYLSAQSETSALLLSLLCIRDFGAPPLITTNQEKAFAKLLIGDEAVLEQRSLSECPHVYDMGTWWWRSVQLPFVFARWVVNSDIPESVQDQLERWLDDCATRSGSLDGLHELSSHAAALIGSESLARRYYGRLRSRLTPADCEGLKTFHGLQSELEKCRQTA